MKRTNSLMRVFAVLMLTMILVSSFAVSASAAVTDTEIGTCKADNTSDDGRTCAKLQEIYGTTSSVKFSTSETETCKYATSITLSTGKVITVYLSQKPTTGDIGVQMGSDGKLEIDGITGGNDGTTSSWNQLFSRFKGVIVGITGVGTLVMIVLFIVQFMKLGASAGNPQARSQALTGVLWTGIAAALLGSVTIIVGFFYNAI